MYPSFITWGRVLSATEWWLNTLTPETWLLDAMLCWPTIMLVAVFLPDLPGAEKQRKSYVSETINDSRLTLGGRFP